jgi:hypothetical protein
MAHVTLYSEMHKFSAVTQFQHYNNVSQHSLNKLNYVQLGHSVLECRSLAAVMPGAVVREDGRAQAETAMCNTVGSIVRRRGVAHVHLVQPFRSCECLAAIQQCLSVTSCTDIRES